MDKKNHNYKKAIVVVSVIAGLVILILGLSNANLSSRVDYYRDNMDWKCEDGTYRTCVNDGHLCVEYNDDYTERAVVLKEDETIAICDTDRKEIGTCVPEDYRKWTTCDEGRATCVSDDYEEWTTCDEGYEAKCLKENIYSYFTGSYVRECNIGEVAYCS